MRIRFALLSTAACLAIASGARAQSVNYGQLEQFFGEPVTTSATGSPQKATDAPANMEIINTDEIRRSGAVDIPDVLRFVAGIDVRRYSQGDADVSVRGSNQAMNPRLLVLINGRQVFSDDYGYTVWDTIPVALEEIRQIEVVRGPSSALFGFNAVAGVINIVTFDPLADSVNSVTARGGTDGYGGGSAVGTFHWGDTAGLRLSASGYRSSEPAPRNQSPVGAADYNVSPYSRKFVADGRVQLAPNVEVSFEGTSAQSDQAFMVAGNSYLADVLALTNSGKVGLAADTSLGLLDLTAYRNDQHLTLASAALGNSTLNNVSYVVQGSDLFKLGTDHTVRVGVEYRNNSLESVIANGTVGYEDYAASAMWNWQILPDLTLTNSLRIDHLAWHRTDPVLPVSLYSVSDYNNSSFTQPSYNSGLVYKVSEQGTIRLLAAMGVQAPSLIAAGIQAPISVGGHLIGSADGNPNLHPTKVTNYEIDYDHALPSLHSILRTAFFVEQARDVISPIESVPTSLPFFTQATRNIGQSRTVGGEIGIKGELNGWRWNASYSLARVKDQLAGSYSLTTPNAVDYADASPTSIIIGGFGYSVGKWEADVAARWQTGYSDFRSNDASVVQPYRIGSYLTSTVRVGYKLLDSLQVAVTAEQLNQASIIQSAGLPVDRRVLFSLGAQF